MSESHVSAIEDRPLQDPSPRSGFEWILGTEPVAVCFACDTTLPAETARCPVCDCAMSIVRRCPGCRRILSAQHIHCIYCSLSFLRRGYAALRSLPIVGRRRPRAPRPPYSGIVIEATMMVALLVLAGFFAYSFFWRYARVERSNRAAVPTATSTKPALSARASRRARSSRSIPPPGSASVYAPETLPLPPAPPLQFTVVGGYDPSPLLHSSN